MIQIGVCTSLLGRSERGVLLFDSVRHFSSFVLRSISVDDSPIRILFCSHLLKGSESPFSTFSICIASSFI